MSDNAPLKTNLSRRALLGRLTVAAGAAYMAPVMLSLSQARASSSGGGSSYSGSSSSAPSYSAPSSSSNSYSAPSRPSSSGRSSSPSKSSFSGPRRSNMTLEAWWRRMFARS